MNIDVRYLFQQWSSDNFRWMALKSQHVCPAMNTDIYQTCFKYSKAFLLF